MDASVAPALERSPHLPTRVAHLLGMAIAGGQWATGQRLPSEQALADLYGVSRNVVREAISRLRAQGLLETRHGVGAFVRRDEPNVLQFDGDMLADPPALRSLFELRAILEIESAGLAALRHDAAGLAAIDGALAHMMAQMDDPMGGVNADLDFHRAVAGAARNAYIAKIISFLSGQIARTILAARTRPGALAVEIIRVTVTEHRRIRDAIAARSADGARAAMADHIDSAAGRIGFRLR